MIKYLVLAIFFAAFGLAALLIYRANKKHKVPVNDATYRLELENLKKELQIKIQTLDNVKEINKLEKQIAGIDAKLDKLKPNS